MNLVDVVNKNYLSQNIQKFPEFKAGDTVSVSVRITEGNKTRIQKFEGTVIAIKGSRNAIDSHFRIRKVTSGYGVERVFPFHSPNVEGIEVKNVG